MELTRSVKSTVTFSVAATGSPRSVFRGNCRRQQVDRPHEAALAPLPERTISILLYPNRMGLESSPRPGRTAARLARQVELALVEVDLSLPQYRILILLDEGKVAASALADRLAVSRPSVTAVVDGLVVRGLVERHHDPGDRRRVGHDLTAEGRLLLKKGDESVDRRLAEIASILSEAGTEATGVDAFKGLECWRAALDAHRTEKHKEQAEQKAEQKTEQKLEPKVATK